MHSLLHRIRIALLCARASWRGMAHWWFTGFERVWAIFLTSVISWLLASSTSSSLLPWSLESCMNVLLLDSAQSRVVLHSISRPSVLSPGPCMERCLSLRVYWIPLRVYFKVIIHLSREKIEPCIDTGLDQISFNMPNTLFNVFWYQLKIVFGFYYSFKHVVLKTKCFSRVC